MMVEKKGANSKHGLLQISGGMTPVVLEGMGKGVREGKRRMGEK
jgi:hypothetical protein